MSELEVNTNQFSGTGYRREQVLRNLYWDKELSLNEIGNIFDVEGETIRKWMDKNGVETRDRVEATKKANTKPYAPLKMHDHGQLRWFFCHNGDKTYVKVSRLLAVAEYGFEEVADKVVHHKNGIPWLDYPENIQLMTQSEHAKHHYENGDTL
jgi:hypothetical protein